VILFPWCWWPAFWQALTEVRRGPIQAPVRFSLACVLPGLLILSLISGKQVHYLMPLLPAFAILGGVACAHLTNQRQTVVLSVLPPIVLLAAHLVGERRLAQRYDLAPIAAFLKAAETDGRPIAYVGHYSGQFHFLGRLDQTFDEISPAQQTQWTADHPRGLVIRDGPRAVIAGTAFARLYGNGMIGIWAANPESR
jgi:hypothetical protein